MTIHWEANPDLDAALLSLSGMGYTAAQIAMTLATDYNLVATPNQVSGRLTRLRLVGQAAPVVASGAAHLQRASIAGFPAPSATPNFDEMFSRPVAPKQRFDSVVADIERQTEARIAIISDTHGTAVDPGAFEWALDVIAKHGADVGIHGGDLFDFANQSDHYTPTSYTSFEDELDGGALTLRAMEQTGFPWLALVANHDVRIEKNVAARVDSYLIPWINNPMNALVDRSDSIFTPNRPNHQAWWVRVGDMIVAHIELASGVESVAAKGARTFQERASDFGFDSSPIRGVFAGHPHRYRQEVRGRRQVLVDLDALAATPEYVLTGPGVKYRNPATQGITFVTMRKGRLDLDSVEHRVYLGGS